ncbi:unnamed protein product [Closterium sp. Yama58-4]|nr:unnamed protein product [Closterium sp. Yama58-4]
MEVAAPHFLWSFAVRYAAHQLNLWPRVSLPETSPTLRWTGKVGDASRFRVWGSRAFVRITTADKLSSRAIPCVFLGFPPDAPGWQFYHPTSHWPLRTSRVSQVDRLPLVEPVDVTGDSGAAGGGLARGAMSGGAEPVGAEPGGAEPERVEPGGAEPKGAETGGVAPERTDPRGAEPGGAASGGAEPGGAASAGGLPGASPQLSPQQLEVLELEALELETLELEALELEVLAVEVLELEVLMLEALELEVLVLEALTLELLELEVLPLDTLELEALCNSVSPSHHSSCASGLPGAPAFGVAQELEALELEVLELEALELEALELEVLELEVLALEALELEALELEVMELEALELGALGLEALALEALELEVLTVEVLELEALELEALELEALALEVLELEALELEALELEALELEALALELLELEVLALEALELEALCSSDRFSCRRRSCPSFRPSRCSVRFLVFLRPLPFLRTHRCLPRPVTLSSRSPLQRVRVPLPSPPASSLPVVPDPESDRVRAASPTVTRLLATVVTDPSFESTAASALVAELVDFDAACRLDYTASLVAESEFVCPPSVGEAISGPYSSQWQTAMDAEMASWKSTSTYVDEVPPPGANIVDGMWKRPPGSPPVFKARYVARGFSQRQGVDYFQTFSPTPKMTTLRVLLHVAAQRDYELHSFDFSTAFLEGSLHEEIWLRRPPGFTGSFPPGTQWSLWRPVYGLRQAPCEWHDTLRTTLAALGFAPSTADPSLFLRTDTSLPPFCILVYVDDLVFATADTEALALVKSELQKRHMCTDLGELRSYLGLQITLTITLTQSHMVLQVLQRFGFQFSSP